MSAYGRLYFGHVAHKRVSPIRHALRYRVFSLVLDIDRVSEIGKSLKFLSAGRFNLFGFYLKDHGPRDGTPLRPWVEEQLHQSRITQVPHKIELLCFPRILGFVFNPLSVYFCLDEAGSLFAIIYEVKNTFGGQHPYVAALAHPTARDQQAPIHGATKAFYVSPFIGMEARYIFHSALPGETLVLTIDERGPEGPILWAGWFGDRRELSDRSLLAAFFSYPLMTLKVVAAIHWEALRLVLKGAKYRPQPQSPSE